MKFISELSKGKRQGAGWFFCLLLILAAHATYVPNGFTWLDHGDLEQGRAIIPLAQWWQAFTTPFAYTGFYRPLVTLLHSLDAALWGSAQGFHCTNILLHCAAAMAAPLFVTAFFPLSPWQRWSIACIFGLHPLAIVPAGGISFRSESLLALFLFLSVWAYGKTRDSKDRRWPALLFLFTLCACLSKETAFFYLPLFFFIREAGRFNRQGFKNGSAWRHEVTRFLLPVISAAAALGLAAGLRYHAMPSPWVLSPPPVQAAEIMGMRMIVLFRHVLNLLIPLPPPLSDAVTEISIFKGAPLCIGLALCGALFFGVRAGIRNRGTLMGLIIAVCLLPAMNVLPLPRFYSPHYAYCAIAPFAAGMVLLAGAIRRRANGPRSLAGWAVVGIWIAAAGVSTVVSGPRFKTDETLFAPEVRKDPRFSEAWFYLGNFYRRAGDLDAAETAYDNGLRQYRGVVRFFDPLEFLINKSATAVQRNELPRADSLMRVAQTMAPDAMLPEVAFIRADIACRRGEFDSVIALLANPEIEQSHPESRRLLSFAVSERKRERDSAAQSGGRP